MEKLITYCLGVDDQSKTRINSSLCTYLDLFVRIVSVETKK